MPTHVLIIDHAAQTYAERLASEFPDLAFQTASTRADLPTDTSKAEILITTGLGVDDGLLQRCPGLKWIQCLATGVDHFIKLPSMRPEIILTSTRGIHGPQMREMALFLMMALSQDAARIVHDQDANRWNRRPRPLLWRRTAVVVGTGIVGSAIAEALKVLEMRVVGVSRTPRKVEGFDAMLPTDRLAEAAAEADYLINVLPGSAENESLIGRAVFDAMKPSAYFVNLGRGDTIDEAALIDTMRTGRIAGAALDVFRGEPIGPDSPFWDLPNTLVTSHLGGLSGEYAEQCLTVILPNMRCYLAGDLAAMQNVVDHG